MLTIRWHSTSSVVRIKRSRRRFNFSRLVNLFIALNIGIFRIISAAPKAFRGFDLNQHALIIAVVYGVCVTGQQKRF